MSNLNEILDLIHNDNHISDITTEKVLRAKSMLSMIPNNNTDLFKLLVAMNLINAALKLYKFDSLVSYALLKPEVSRLFHHLIENQHKFAVDFYITGGRLWLYRG
eukprot:UN04698